MLLTERCSPALNVFIVKKTQTHRTVEKTAHLASVIWKAKVLPNLKPLWALTGCHCGQFYTYSYMVHGHIDTPAHLAGI